MPEINGLTLMMAIQAVESKMQEIERRLDDPGCENGAELDALLLSYENTAAELKIGYEQALSLSSNLPAYEQLIGKSDS